MQLHSTCATMPVLVIVQAGPHDSLRHLLDASALGTPRKEGWEFTPFLAAMASKADWME